MQFEILNCRTKSLNASNTQLYRSEGIVMKIPLILLCIALLIIPSLEQQLYVGGTYGRDWLNNSGNKNIIQASSGYWNYSAYPPGYNYGYPAYVNPYLYDPQYELDQAIANHEYQILSNYYNRFYRTYPWRYMPYGMPISIKGIGYIGFNPGY